jgi:hypothetical protein
MIVEPRPGISIELELRPHWRYKPVDWLTGGIWMALAYVLWPPFRRRMKNGKLLWVTWGGKTFTGARGTVYFTPGNSPDGKRLLHEAWHVWQDLRDGVLLRRWRLASQRWRIWYEAEAYAVEGTPPERTVDCLLAGAYFVFWRRSHVLALVQGVYRRMGLL